MTLIQPQHKSGAFKGLAKGQCLNCMDEQECDLRVPVNKREWSEKLNQGELKGEKGSFLSFAQVNFPGMGFDHGLNDSEP